MKKLNSIAIGFLFLLLAVGANAQSKAGADFFAGKWKVLVTGTPYGDLKRIYVLEKGDIVETGSHEKLLEEKGLYYAMWRQQIGERKKLTAA